MGFPTPYDIEGIAADAGAESDGYLKVKLNGS
jgi:hypothetical protein